MLGVDGTRGVSTEFGPGELLRILRDGGGATRDALIQQTGLSRSAISTRLRSLVAGQLVRESTLSDSVGGRPPVHFHFRADVNVVLVASIGRSRVTLAVTDLGGAPLADDRFEVVAGDTVSSLLQRLVAGHHGLLHRVSRSMPDVLGVGVAVPVPAPRDGERGRATHSNPWDRLPAWLSSHYGAPTFLDHDVNVMAFGEQWIDRRCGGRVLYVRTGATLHAGVVAGGRTVRGANGVVGEIGHIRIAGESAICRCGGSGCLDAVVGSAALLQRMQASGTPVASVHDVARLAQAGDQVALEVVQRAGGQLGEVLALCVSFFDPGTIVIGGPLAPAGHSFLSAIHDSIRQRCSPLVSRDLRLVAGQLNERAVVLGAAGMVIERVLAPAVVDRAVELGAPIVATAKRCLIDGKDAAEARGEMLIS